MSGISIDEALKRAKFGEETALSVIDVLDEKGQPGGKKLLVEARKVPAAAPRRAETPSRAHEFHDVRGFIDYLGKYGTDNTVVYADAPGRTIHAVLNELSDQGGGVEHLRLKPKIHPRFQPWLDLMEEEPQPLPVFVDFLRNHRRTVKQPEGRELQLTLAQIKASTHIELHQGSGKESVNGLLVRSKIEGKETAGVPLDLPETLILRTPIFVNEDAIDVTLDLILNTTRDGAGVTAHVATADLQEALIDGFEKMVALIEHDFDDRFVVGWGYPDYAEWSYIDKHDPHGL